MNNLFYPKLALTNIKKNGKFYFPYVLTCIGTIAMFYIMTFICFNEGLDHVPGSQSMKSMMYFGCFIIGIFAFIFLFYTNSFLMKRRKKEFGLFNILGMEKQHIAKVMMYETIFIGLISLCSGLICGILFSKLVTMLLSKLLRFETAIAFTVSKLGIMITVILFVGIFFCMLLSNFAKIQLSKPIELLYGNKTGEKEPKTKIILALIGFGCIGVGYYFALTTESPIAALGYFFLAVFLVIIGTYCLFTAGSIFVLKILRKKKSYYYKTKHFTTISGLLYRMKQNAVGLANICILSTMVLVMVSGTVCLYLGVEDALNGRFPNDINLNYTYDEEQELDDSQIETRIQTVLDRMNQEGSYFGFEFLSFSGLLNGSKLQLDTDNYVSNPNYHLMTFLTAEEYGRLTGNYYALEPDQVLIYSEGQSLPQEFELLGTTYHISNTIEKLPFDDGSSAFLLNLNYLVVADDNVLDTLYQKQKEAFGKYASKMRIDYSIDLPNSSPEEKLDVYDALKQEFGDSVRGESREATRSDFYSMYGGFLFLGIFLGLLFIMATVLIIYYKQISEGYDDKERFQIMQKVGMTKAEVKKSIHSQVMLVFFLPLITAAIHVLAAFKIITKLLALLNIVNVSLFIACTIGTVICFGLIYGLVYVITARVYYKIVY